MDPSSDGQSNDAVFGVITADPAALNLLVPLCDTIAARAGYRVRAEIFDSYAKIPSAIESGMIQVAWSPPLVAYRLTRQGKAVLLAVKRKRTGINTHSVLFTSARGRARKLADLRGLTAAWVDPTSLSGCMLARRWCLKFGQDPDKVLTQQSHLKTHAAVARAVIAGHADVGATYANIETRSGRVADAGWTEIGRSREDVHIIATIGPIPSNVILASTRASDALCEAVAAAMTSLGGAAGPSLRAIFRTEGFDRPPPGYLETIARLLA